MGYIEDLVTIKTLDPPKFEALLKHANSNEFNTLQDSELFEKVCRDNDIPLKTGRSLIRMLAFVTDVVMNQRDIEAGLEYFQTTYINQFNGEKDVKESWIRLKSNYTRLSEFFNSRKRDRLRNVVPQVSSINLICDIRPVFGVRKEIEGYLYPVILKVETQNDKTFLCELTPEMLSDLKREVDYASFKVDSIRKVVKTQNGQR